MFGRSAWDPFGRDPRFFERRRPVPAEPLIRPGAPRPRWPAEPLPAPVETSRPPLTEPAQPRASDAAVDAAVDATESELEATKERLHREAQRELAQSKLDLVRPLLPVLDNLDRTIEAARSGAAPGDREQPGLLEGLELVRSQFESVLESYGLTRIDAVGEPFDPSVHEAVAAVPVDDRAADGSVIDEWQRGYRLGDRVLRPSAVRVGRFARPAPVA